MKVGIALRSTLFPPSTIARTVPRLEESNVDSLWFPSVGHEFDALDMCGISLGMSKRLSVGTGVIRFTDYDAPRLLARVHTLTEASGGRFVLGVGTGPFTGREAIERLVQMATTLRADYRDGRRPRIFFAALRKRMLRVAYRSADGAILNFCPPGYVKEIVPGDLDAKGFTLACYVKLFFAEKDSVAREMLVDEMKTYNALPQYHAMFKEIGSSTLIEKSDPSSSHTIPDDLLEISLANPDAEAVTGFLGRFRRAGVDLPIVYPYVAGDDRFKVTVLDRLISVLG